MSKYAIRRVHGNVFWAGEVVHETEKKFSVKQIEGCPHSPLSDTYWKTEAVFVSENKQKTIRMMVVYHMITEQYKAVVNAAESSYKANLDILCSQGKEPTAEQSSNQK